MLTTNPFSELAPAIPSIAMQVYVVLMVLLVGVGTLIDVVHKKSAKYFFMSAEKAKQARTRELSWAVKVSTALRTVAVDVLGSGEFCNTRRRISHLLTMYGFLLFIITTAIMVFAYPTSEVATPAVLPVLWHLGALMVCVGGYWFWFVIRVNVAAEGDPWYRIMPADLFVLSLLASTTFALIWSALQAAGAGGWASVFFALFIVASTVLFGGVPWSKFAHMFYKPAAALQKHLAEADGSRQNLPPPTDKPEKFGLGIKRELPHHY
jgi:hypothetical protein